MCYGKRNNGYVEESVIKRCYGPRLNAIVAKSFNPKLIKMVRVLRRYTSSIICLHCVRNVNLLSMIEAATAMLKQC